MNTPWRISKTIPVGEHFLRAAPLSSRVDGGPAVRSDWPALGRTRTSAGGARLL